MSKDAKLFHIMAEKMFEISKSESECKELDINDVSQVLWALGNYFDNVGGHSTAASVLTLASALTEDDCDCVDDCVFNILQMLSDDGYLRRHDNENTITYSQTAIGY